MRRRRLTDEDRKLWERVTRDVKPLSPPPTEASVPAMAAASEAKPRGAEEAERAAGASTPPLPPVKAPAAPKPRPSPTAAIDRRTLRKLARGAMAIDGRIDLHGMTEAQAHNALVRFIETSVASRRRMVLVITGKGSGGEGRGILRRAVPHWLNGRELGRHVVGFGAAQPVHGGEGALYVRLRVQR